MNGFIRESQYRLLLNEARGDKIGGGEAAYKAGGNCRADHFMSDYFQIDIDDIRCGKVTVSLLTDPIKHTNHREVLHGGVMMALADSVTGVTGASVGAVVVTVSLTMSFIRNARPGSRIRVKSHITHNGRTTIVIAAEMYDEDDKLMANILADMMIVDHFPEIPRKW